MSRFFIIFRAKSIDDSSSLRPNAYASLENFQKERKTYLFSQTDKILYENLDMFFRDFSSDFYDVDKPILKSWNIVQNR